MKKLRNTCYSGSSIPFTDFSSGTEFDDWFLPSRVELDTMYTNLHMEGVGNFESGVGTRYRSSSELASETAWAVSFTNGLAYGENKASLYYVRACRSFTAAIGVYALRDTGPAGGLIFHIDGTTYCETAPSDQSTGKAWSNIDDVLIGTTGTAIGTGQANTLAIIAQAGGANDWFLPSKDELNAMYTNLYLEGVGGFADTGYYWSSTEIDSIYVWLQYFGNGSQSGYTKNNTIRIRACRSFTAAIGVYALRDTGPAGGLIFHIDGTTYYEAAPSDQSTGKAWSNITDALAGATDITIGTGQANTTAVISQTGHTDSAAKLCDDLDNVYAHTDSAAKLCDDLILKSWR